MASIKLSTDRQAGPLDIPAYGLQTDRYEFYPPAITHDQRKERLTYTYMTPTLIDESTLGQAVFIYLYLASVLYPRESESEKVPRPGSKITISGISVGGRFGYPTLIIEESLALTIESARSFLPRCFSYLSDDPVTTAADAEVLPSSSQVGD
ncbi:hypothetical protein L1987_88405 [Smallanthus sonchifolius]|nr:hypothetical protein L1987_89810 [Smallanthus sonchifolius]KAI3664569.1 hypothetical protein L1987_89671 [Smallanthus sonchifolius]KAI3666262.1 hypothetical protein L1987_89240 [Smallanthus sonchifolius]KAI3666387.1 hypothetical protein L1987_89105 [Smallanthus sonchifolius]KAI3668489.1 hypothetical protein L1987_88511 [Smallanthus sonchifolius]